MSLNIYTRKSSHPMRINPRGSTVKRYRRCELTGKLVEIDLTAQAKPVKSKGKRG